MTVTQYTRAGGLGRGLLATAVAAPALVALAWGGPAAAAGRAGGVGRPGAGHAGAAAVIATVAGGLGGPARGTRVALGQPCGVGYGGGLYVADWYTVRKVDPRTGGLTTPAGGGINAFEPIGDGGPAVSASLSVACATATDHHGNVLIADAGHFRIRVIAHQDGKFYGRTMTAGDIYTVAGGGTRGLGDGGPATSARLNEPRGVAVDRAGNLLIADAGNLINPGPGSQRIRVVAESTGTFYGQPMTAGDIYTVAGNGARGYSGDGGPATSAKLNGPDGVAVDLAGNLLIDDTLNSRIRVVAESTGTFYGQAMTVGDIYTVAGDGATGYAGDGGPATAAALGFPDGVAVDGAGNLLTTSASRVRVLAASTGTFYGQAMVAGDIYSVAGGGASGLGDGGPATSAELLNPDGVAVDGAGNLLIADYGDARVRAVAVSTGMFYGRAMTAGDIYTVGGNGTASYSGDGRPAVTAQFAGPRSVVVDGKGNLVLADEANQRIRVVAKASGTFYGRPMTAGDIYTVAGTGRPPGLAGCQPAAQGWYARRQFAPPRSADLPATKADLNDPQGAAVDAAGNLVIADTNNCVVGVVAEHTGTFYGRPMKAGDIYAVAGDGIAGYFGNGIPGTSAELNEPGRVAVDHAGNLVVADTGNSRIRVVAARAGTFYGRAMTAGDIYTIAGAGRRGILGDGIPATKAILASPMGVAADGAGNILIADSLHERIRVVAARTGTFYGQAMTAGDIYTVAGNGINGFSGDGGPATQAELAWPQSATVDGAGNLLIADYSNQRIRVVAEQTGTFYGQAMTAGDIYSVAGGGDRAGDDGLGDGGPATKAVLNSPGDAVADSSGNLLIADTANNRVRIVTP